MSPHDFFFSLEFSSQGAPAALLDELATRVLAHVGCGGDERTELSDALRKAVEESSVGGARRCDIQFRAQNGTLGIVVSANGGRVWQTSRAVP